MDTFYPFAATLQEFIKNRLNTTSEKDTTKQKAVTMYADNLKVFLIDVSEH